MVGSAILRPVTRATVSRISARNCSSTAWPVAPSNLGRLEPAQDLPRRCFAGAFGALAPFYAVRAPVNGIPKRAAPASIFDKISH